MKDTVFTKVERQPSRKIKNDKTFMYPYQNATFFETGVVDARWRIHASSKNPPPIS